MSPAVAAAAAMAQNESSKRAASMLTIAQHKFKQALKKEDTESRLPPVAVELSAQFLSDLNAAIRQNTPLNIQKCTTWIIKHIAPSGMRIASLGDYLTYVSKTIIVDRQTAKATAVKSAARVRRVPLLIINDVLHADQFHHRSAAKSGIFSKKSMSFVPELVELATAYVSEKESVAEKQLRALLNYWAVNQVFSAEDIKALRDQVDEGLLIAQGGTPVRKRNNHLPMYHGDQTAPWHDLPASYMLEQIIKRSSRPMNSRRFKVAKLEKRAVSTNTHRMLDNYLANLDLKFVPTGDKSTGEIKRSEMSRNHMGHLVARDQGASNERKIAGIGVGWSTTFSTGLQKDGIPSNIKRAREEAQREDEDGPEEFSRLTSQHRASDGQYGSSSQRRPSLPSQDDYRREHVQRSRSGSYSSSSSYHSRQDSERVPPRQEHQIPRNQGRAYDGREGNQQRPPPRPYGRGSSGSGQQWNGSNASGRTQGAHNSDQHSSPVQNATQGFSQPPQPPFTTAPFQQQPMSNQFPGQFPGLPGLPGQFPMQPFPTAPPFQAGAFPNGMPGPPPPNYNGPFPPPPPNMTAMANNPYNFGGNQFGNNAQGNHSGYSHNAGHAQTRGNFQGGRGGSRGNHRGGGYNNNNHRGGYGGQQRGQRGGW